ncbi:IS110 family transposase [Anaerobacillus isosaccharinicus]|uniref:IS110 family transposase n=1 Tax=Anaerobacillus isosaccharinicus TaxID=1532552 RepID=A0A1S2L0H6_9BACI|nr:IS110 family transposase [Anaerobacillus isosaccharinicus]MBA5586663.1 IS110 family transposase [Anaerobacillus isosaccharinicus]MBA5588445.1 IS110 family transposase [Anaerobacillus isosaccharinicus]MBA5588461.1 IS110 family transposase [Anaerobacillus isosaccharinicus]MBA5588884.1 IS110 family transposase [Anaerobacillus isosaccharinicus]QOY34123.1 IS110 family transposase [Anaerobacillus isosaccharinicus]
MNFKQNEKINQVTEKTLVVGMDIAKRTHFACFTDDRGRVLQKSFPVSQSHDGFEQFYQKILAALREHDKSEVIVGIEPTGHYWLNLAYFLEDLGISLVMTNPMHVKRSKELDDNLPTKHDRKDALVIARLVKDGRFSYPRILKDMEAELRAGSTFRSKLTEELGAVKNMMIRWLDRYFPEFTQVFPSFGKMALAVLECTPFPSDLHERQLEEVMTLYREVDGIKSPQKPKAMRLIEVAANSIGITEGRQMARYEITTLVQRYHQLEKKIDDITQQLVELVQTSVEYESLKTVPGLGDSTIVDLLAEIGSFSHYEDPRQLIKLAGLTLRENSSGQHKGQKRISKRGRRKLRALLFRVMMPMLRHNEAFRKLHEYYTNRSINPLRKKQSIVVLCGKLLKVLHGISTKHKAFDAQRMMRDIPSLVEAV